MNYRILYLSAWSSKTGLQVAKEVPCKIDQVTNDPELGISFVFDIGFTKYNSRVKDIDMVQKLVVRFTRSECVALNTMSWNMSMSDEYPREVLGQFTRSIKLHIMAQIGEDTLPVTIITYDADMPYNVAHANRLAMPRAL